MMKQKSGKNEKKFLLLVWFFVFNIFSRKELTDGGSVYKTDSRKLKKFPCCVLFHRCCCEYSCRMNFSFHSKCCQLQKYSLFWHRFVRNLLFVLSKMLKSQFFFCFVVYHCLNGFSHHMKELSLGIFFNGLTGCSVIFPGLFKIISVV